MMSPLVFLCLLLSMLLDTEMNIGVSAECGYQSCPKWKPGMLNVHLVAHTHDDVGWLNTVDQYYYGGSRTSGVQYILDSVVGELLLDSNRRFSYAEMAFFWRWWNDITDSQRELVRGLVKDGRLEFVNGGWSLSDEATSHYTMLIDQMTLGLRFLNDTFGECGRPRVAWQIDPFGHSSELASEFAQMGFDGLFLGRISNEDIWRRKVLNEMEFLWAGSRSLGTDSSIFSTVNFNLYHPPPGFCFEDCESEPIVDNPKSHLLNLRHRITIFVDRARNYARYYKTKHVMMTMGDDFAYEKAPRWFRNMDKIIKFTNSRKEMDVNVMYSTPSCYLKAVHEANETWTIQDKDFLPLETTAGYWSGYYTSRPTLKYFTYRANNLLQVCRQLRFVLGDEFAQDELELKMALGILQHHDAITGTCKQHVANDYAQFLAEGTSACGNVVAEAYRKVLPKQNASTDFSSPWQVPCPLLNISECPVSEFNERFVVTVYNPLTSGVTTPVRVPVVDGTYEVTGPQEKHVFSELFLIPESLAMIPGRKGMTTHELVFFTLQLPPLGLHSYYVQRLSGQSQLNTPDKKKFSISYQKHFLLKVGNEFIQLYFDRKTGFLDSIWRNGTCWPFKQNFYWYRSIGGPYILQVTNRGSQVASSGGRLKVQLGTNVLEVLQTFDGKVDIRQLIRLYDGRDEIEFDWMIGETHDDDFSSGYGVEIVTRYSTHLNTNGAFYTDANGRELQRRVRLGGIDGNFYPATTGAVLKDKASNQMSVLIDRPEGVASLADGQLEFLLNRRVEADASLGLHEGLKEEAFGKQLFVRGKHIVHLGSVGDNPSPMVRYRRAALQTAFGPWLTFTPLEISRDDWENFYKTQFQLLNGAELPDNVHLLTLEKLSSGLPTQFLVRFKHIFEKNEDELMSKTATVNLEEFFKPYTILKVEELTLGANQFKMNSHRLKWKTMSKSKEGFDESYVFNDSGTSFILRPMQIRTFLLELS